ncbi:MAG: DUF962 domain-containing protein [Pseudomonadaceae bacterium]|nr:DUF962 domain-containing protein [Pseudomonadaceae bacterium]
MTLDKRPFREELKKQRWDDHRYYHQSRINQSLHLFSAVCFILSYCMVFFSISAAAILGWIFAMSSRQIGHFFFEPKTYDDVNKATHQRKEEIKIGYNLFRKRVLHAVCAAFPVVLYFEPSLFGIFAQYGTFGDFVNNLSVSWLVLAMSALVFRAVQIFFIHDIRTGIIWLTKIATDPFHDFKIYLKSPVHLMKGQLFDPMDHVQDNAEGEPSAAGISSR